MFINKSQITYISMYFFMKVWLFTKNSDFFKTFNRFMNPLYHLSWQLIDPLPVMAKSVTKEIIVPEDNHTEQSGQQTQRK